MVASCSPGSDYRNLGPDWSPDGASIAFARAHRPPGDIRYRGDIYVVRADGTGLRRLTRGSVLHGINETPAWSPDGKQIVFASDRYHEDIRVNYVRTDIYVMNADGTKQKRLTTGFNQGEPAWRPLP